MARADKSNSNNYQSAIDDKVQGIVPFPAFDFMPIPMIKALMAKHGNLQFIDTSFLPVLKHC